MSGTFLEDVRRTIKNLFKIGGVSAEIRTEDLLSRLRVLEYYRYANLLIARSSYKVSRKPADWMVL
jgi:hypothetical protein